MHLIALHDTAGLVLLGPKFIYMKFSPLLSTLAAEPLGSAGPSRLAAPGIIKKNTIFFRRAPRPKTQDAFILPNFKPKTRIGPHHEEVLSVLVGSLLGDGLAERLESGGVRFIFRQQIKHNAPAYKKVRFMLAAWRLEHEYIFWLYDFFNKRGYCSNNLPFLGSAEKKYGSKTYKAYRFNTYGFTSWMWLYKLFYKKNKVKIIPKNIGELITPLALAIWIMDDGTRKKRGVRVATNCFTKNEVEFLILTLYIKFNLNCSLHKYNDKYQLYIKQESLPLLKELILPYILPNMLNKLGL